MQGEYRVLFPDVEESLQDVRTLKERLAAMHDVSAKMESVYGKLLENFDTGKIALQETTLENELVILCNQEQGAQMVADGILELLSLRIDGQDDEEEDDDLGIIQAQYERSSAPEPILLTEEVIATDEEAITQIEALEPAITPVIIDMVPASIPAEDVKITPYEKALEALFAEAEAVALKESVGPVQAAVESVREDFSEEPTAPGIEVVQPVEDGFDTGSIEAETPKAEVVVENETPVIDDSWLEGIFY